jgi:transcriptional regulator with XRE-family HTH domain
MVKLSELRTANEVRAGDMQDLDYRREYERTRLANDVAIKVIQYRVANRLSQAELARRLGMLQPNIARLESGEREPSLSTLSRLAQVLNQDFSVEVKRGRLRLRNPARGISERVQARLSNQTGRSKPARVAAAGRPRVADVAASAGSSRRAAQSSAVATPRKSGSPSTGVRNGGRKPSDVR